MAKFVVPVEQLPPPNASGNHVFRFRVLSEDRNRQSPYSTLYVIESKGQIYPLESDFSVSSAGSLVSVYWDTPSYYNIGASAVGASVLHNHGSEIRAHFSDVFLSWDSQDYVYFGRTQDTNINVIKKTGATTLKVRVQAANYSPVVSDRFKILETGIISL